MTELHAGGRQIARVRMQLVTLHGWVCWRCGDPIDPQSAPSSPLGLSIGHVVARANGGTDHPSNLRPEHLACNREAGAEFLGMAGDNGKGAAVKAAASARLP